MLPENPPITQDLQPSHTKAKLLLHAKHENHHLVTQQTTAITLQLVQKFNTNSRQRV